MSDIVNTGKDVTDQFDITVQPIPLRSLIFVTNVPRTVCRIFSSRGISFIAFSCAVPLLA